MHPRWVKQESRKRKTRKWQVVLGDRFLHVCHVPGASAVSSWTQAGNSCGIEVHLFRGISEWMPHWHRLIREGRDSWCCISLSVILFPKDKYGVWTSLGLGFPVYHLRNSASCAKHSYVITIIKKDSFLVFSLSQSKWVCSAMTGLKSSFVGSQPRSGCC